MGALRKMPLKRAQVALQVKLGLIVLLRCLLVVLAALLKVVAEVCNLLAWTTYTLADHLSQLLAELAKCMSGTNVPRQPAGTSDLWRASEQISKHHENEQLKDVVTKLACRRTSFLPSVFEAVALKLHTDYSEGTVDARAGRRISESPTPPTIYCPTRSEQAEASIDAGVQTISLPRLPIDPHSEPRALPGLHLPTTRWAATGPTIIESSSQVISQVEAAPRRLSPRLRARLAER